MFVPVEAELVEALVVELVVNPLVVETVVLDAPPFPPMPPVVVELMSPVELVVVPW